MYKDFAKFVKQLYGRKELVPLSEPCFTGNEKKYLIDAIDSTYVSSIGEYVDKFEGMLASYTGCKYAVATVNGTSALHIALLVAGVRDNDEVITQSLTFVATCNAICYCGARPIFIDVERETLGMSAKSLSNFIEANAEVRNDGHCYNIKTGNVIRACVPMHTFGFPVDIEAIRDICDKYKIKLVEDAAESLGSTRHNKHTGRTGIIAITSFNGNKIITTGGGGMIFTDDEQLALDAKHISTTAKTPHAWLFTHDQVAFNYRLPNINAALGCAQVEKLPDILKSKRYVASVYEDWFENVDAEFVKEPPETHANYWLNSLIFNSKDERDTFLSGTNGLGVITRAVWAPMHKLAMYTDCTRDRLDNTNWLAERLVNIPSSVL